MFTKVAEIAIVVEADARLGHIPAGLRCALVGASLAKPAES